MTCRERVLTLTSPKSILVLEFLRFFEGGEVEVSYKQKGIGNEIRRDRKMKPELTYRELVLNPTTPKSILVP